MNVVIIDWVESIKVCIAEYEFEFKFEQLKGGAGDKIDLKEKTKN